MQYSPKKSWFYTKSQVSYAFIRAERRYASISDENVYTFISDAAFECLGLLSTSEEHATDRMRRKLSSLLTNL